MNSRYLEITYRHGRPLAAYFYLARKNGDTSVRAAPGEAGLVTDYAADGCAIGIEITSPRQVTLAAFNRALTAAHQPPVLPDDIAPLLGNEFEKSASG
jgi:hypothetical protein